MIQEDISKMIYILQNVKFDDDGFAINLENRYSDGGSSWGDCSCPIWDFYTYEYRIKDDNKIEKLSKRGNFKDVPKKMFDGIPNIEEKKLILHLLEDLENAPNGFVVKSYLKTKDCEYVLSQLKNIDFIEIWAFGSSTLVVKCKK